jgi:hypothetical protein
MVPAQLAPFVQNKRPFYLEARVSPSASSEQHARTVRALREEASRIRDDSGPWFATPDFDAVHGVYRVHLKPPSENAVAMMFGAVLGSVLAAALLNVIRPQR